MLVSEANDTSIVVLYHTTKKNPYPEVKYHSSDRDFPKL